MIASLKWLKRYLPELNASVDEISKALTAVGLEIEGVEELGAAYENLVVGEVREREQHPDADKLSVTKLFDGKDELQVVCGAPNVAAGQKVVFAPVGTKLPLPDGKELKLKKAKIRGVESLGMICAEDEIGLGNSHAGIMVLDSKLEAGTSILSLGFYDTLFEINVTPNRPDALNHIGIARELAAYFNIPLVEPTLPEVQKGSQKAEDVISVAIAENCGCTTYIARVVKGVKIEPSPKWMQNLLNAVGVRPINNVVDITNFVLLEYGQPLHAFDLAKMKSGRIEVRLANEGEKIVTLDEQERVLKADELLICDGETAACVAGVMGGKETEVDDSTVDILLETAWFVPGVIRKQARRLALSSDSSYRFERGIDPFMQEKMSLYAASLIASICGGTLLESKVEARTVDHKKEADQVTLRHFRIAKILGFSPSPAEVRKYLQGIGLELLQEHGDDSIFSIPGFRPDLTREVDLIEEIARLAGFDNVPTLFPKLELRANPLAKDEVVQRKIRRYLSAVGMNEGLSLRFIRKQDVEDFFGLEDSRGQVVGLENAISQEWGVMPTSHMPKLLKNISFNGRNQEKSFALFELNRAFFAADELTSAKHPGVLEKQLLSGALAGVWNTTGALENPEIANLLYLKSILIGLFRQLYLEVEFKRPVEVVSYFHPLKQLDVFLKGEKIGELGELHPALKERFEVEMDTNLFELDFDAIVRAFGKVKTFTPFAKFGEMKREISCLVPKNFDHSAFLEKVENFKVKNLVEVRLASIYEGKGVPDGKKSVNYQFIYQSFEKTLTDEEVNRAQNKLAEKLGLEEEIEYR